MVHAFIVANGYNHPLRTSSTATTSATLVQGNLGFSYTYNERTSPLLQRNSPKSALLVGLAYDRPAGSLISVGDAAGAVAQQADRLRVDRRIVRRLLHAGVLAWPAPDRDIRRAAAPVLAGGTAGRDGRRGAYPADALVLPGRHPGDPDHGHSSCARKGARPRIEEPRPGLRSDCAREGGVAVLWIVFRHLLRQFADPDDHVPRAQPPGHLSLGAVDHRVAFNYLGMGLLFWTSATTHDSSGDARVHRGRGDRHGAGIACSSPRSAEQRSSTCGSGTRDRPWPGFVGNQARPAGGRRADECWSARVALPAVNCHRRALPLEGGEESGARGRRLGGWILGVFVQNRLAVLGLGLVVFGGAVQLRWPAHLRDEPDPDQPRLTVTCSASRSGASARHRSVAGQRRAGAPDGRRPVLAGGRVPCGPARERRRHWAGAIAGYTWKWVDAVKMRTADLLPAIPPLLYILMLASVVTPTVPVLIHVIALISAGHGPAGAGGRPLSVRRGTTSRPPSPVGHATSGSCSGTSSRTSSARS